MSALVDAPEAALAEATAPIAASPPSSAVATIIPGLALAALVAGCAYALRQLPGMATFSPLIIAVVLGMAFNNVAGTPLTASPGITFAIKRILRWAIALLGLQLTATQIAAVGFSGFAVIALTLMATFVVTVRLGRILGVDAKLAQLIAAGTSICGASAVVATNTVTNADDEDVAYAIACVTLFGSIAMFVYPLLPALLDLNPHAYGLWSGASIHEIAQVVAAAFQDGQAAGEFGTISKLTRVMLLAPMVIALGMLVSWRAKRSGVEETRARPPLPWFVLGFVALVGVNSLVAIPNEIKAAAFSLTTFMLAMALAAMGLATSLAKLKAKGLRPLALGALSFLFIASFSLALVKLTA